MWLWPWNGMRFAPRIDMVIAAKRGLKQTWDWIHWQWIYHVQTPFDQTSQIYINLPRWLFTPNKNAKTNMGIKATKTARTVLDTSCCILKLKRPLNFLNIKHHDLAIWMDTYQVIRRTNRLKVKVVTKFNTKKCHVFQVWSDHLGLRILTHLQVWIDMVVTRLKPLAFR